MAVRVAFDGQWHDSEETEDDGVSGVPSFQCEPFISFGRMPIANGFLTPDEFGERVLLRARVGFCPRCTWCS